MCRVARYVLLFLNTEFFALVPVLAKLKDETCKIGELASPQRGDGQQITPMQHDRKCAQWDYLALSELRIQTRP